MSFFKDRFSKQDTTFSSIDLHICIAIAIVLLSFIIQFGYVHAATFTPKITYNCNSNGSTSSGHCYAIRQWNSAPAFYTNIFTNKIYAGDGHISDEMWDSAGNNWVEAGDTSSSVSIPNGSGYYNHGSTAEFLFWADNRPGSLFDFHAGPNLASSDFGKYMYVEIARTSSSSFDVSIGSLPSASLGGTSTNNSMPNGDQQIGSELVGTNGATNPSNGYAYNQWYNPNGGGSWNYQSVTPQDPPPGEQSPEHGTWTSNSTGGLFSTCLIGAGC